MALENFSIYYTWKTLNLHITKKFKTSALSWNDEFDLPDGSYSISYIQDYFMYIIKKHETITDNPSVQIYTNKIKSRIFLKVKTGYKLKLSSHETIKLSGSTKKMLIKMEKMYQN